MLRPLSPVGAHPPPSPRTQAPYAERVAWHIYVVSSHDAFAADDALGVDLEALERQVVIPLLHRLLRVLPPFGCLCRTYCSGCSRPSPPPPPRAAPQLLTLRQPQQHFTFTTHRLSMSEDPKLAMAYATALRHATVPVLKLDGSYAPRGQTVAVVAGLVARPQSGHHPLVRLHPTAWGCRSALSPVSLCMTMLRMTMPRMTAHHAPYDHAGTSRSIAHTSTRRRCATRCRPPCPTPPVAAAAVAVVEARVARVARVVLEVAAMAAVAVATATEAATRGRRRRACCRSSSSQSTRSCRSLSTATSPRARCRTW